jgi:hypothetical protein
MHQEGICMFKLVKAAIVAAVAAVAIFAITTIPVRAGFFFKPTPCDFITGGGFIFTDLPARANFGAHGGCKHESFWGHVNYVDHGGFNGVRPYHVNSTEITGYLTSDKPEHPNAREICGFARTNADENLIRFRVRMEDNGEPGRDDRFGIVLDNGYWVTTRDLGGDGSGGGNIQLHKPNNSTTGPNPPPSEAEMCGGLPSPGD